MAADSARNLALHHSRVFDLPGNPSTGYHWYLNRGRSTGTNVVKVDSLGYARGGHKPGLVGAPAPFRFRITCVKAGVAHLRFDYIGPTHKPSGKHHDLSVRCY
ncbi:MAG: protease inhibitor I42 family protein [Pseudolabrys sp.]